ncbi:MAG: antitoxin family protein [Chloroflexi bacterium]|nr:antitoxin family protein [Chloroflexota bacterium]MBI3760285.1 antitoxin family protein [Chloroflexota bacterium]
MMMPVSIQAVYRDGTLQPKTKLDLPDDTPVQVLVMPLTATGKPSLFGAFPQLAALSDEIVWAKQLLNESLGKQMTLLSEAA